jgi:hypothetical protein
VEDQFAGRVLLQLLSPDNPRYLPPAVLEMMHPPQRTVVGGTGAMVTDVEGGDEVRRPRCNCSFAQLCWHGAVLTHSLLGYAACKAQCMKLQRMPWFL